MTVTYLLDTNMVSYIAKNRSAAARGRLLGLKRGEVACLSAVTEAEVLYGLAKRPEATALRTLMEGFVARFQVLPWGRPEARAYGTLRAGLAAQGCTLGSMDLMIAAHAVATGAVLVTNDRVLGRVDGLRGSENWAAEL